MQVQRAKFAGADVSGTDWSRVDAGEALLKGVKGLMSVRGYDVAGTETSRGAPPPLGMDAFSFELYMQRRNLPPLQVHISHAFAHARFPNTFNNPLMCPPPPPSGHHFPLPHGAGASPPALSLSRSIKLKSQL